MAVVEGLGARDWTTELRVGSVDVVVQKLNEALGVGLRVHGADESHILRETLQE